jgi:DNA modification methylase
MSDYQVIHGDCTEAMKDIASDSVHLTITSPPYLVGKSYEIDWTLEYFTELMRGVFEQVYRLLVPGGYFVVNFGDCFNSGNRFYDAEVPSVYPATPMYFNWGREVGFDLQATRIWRKQFAKMGIPFCCNSHPRPVFDYEHIWTFRKKSGTNKEIVNDRKLSQRGVLGEDWSSPAKLEVHCAAFPVDLPLWAIDVYSQPGDVVLEPFLGSGTTGVAAMIRGRKFIGIEKDEKFVEIANRRIEQSLNVL